MSNARAKAIPMVSLLLAAGCSSGGDPKPHDPTGGTPTGTPSGAATGTPTGTGTPGGTPTGTTSTFDCPTEYARIALDVCASSDSPWAQPGLMTPSFDGTIAGTVAAPTGVELPAVWGWFDPCNSSFPADHQLELIDGSGYRWVVGWSAPDGDGVAAALAGLDEGDPVELYVKVVQYADEGEFGLSLRDGAGPLVGWAWTGAFGGYDFTVSRADELGVDVTAGPSGCTLTAEPYPGSVVEIEALRVRFTGDGGVVGAFSGERPTLPATGRSLEVVVGDAFLAYATMSIAEVAVWPATP